MKRNPSVAALVLTLTSFAQGSDAASATGAVEPDAADQGLQEIVVTATRREERLQDVPISVTAFSQEALDSKRLRNIDDLTRLSPGVTFQRNGSGAAANFNDENSDINIRGIDSTAGTSTTGVYIDDTPIQSRHISFGAVNAYPALFDLDRVEVLRGPQGTLFGAGSEGGTVRFITPDPGLSGNSGYLRSELATTRNGDRSYESGAAAGGPIIDDVLGFRVSASYRRDGGYVDRVAYSASPDPAAPNLAYLNTTLPDNNWQETVTFRAAMKWAVNDAVTILPSFYYQKLRINDTAAYWVGLSNPSADVFRSGAALSNPSTDPLWLAAVKVNWNLGFAILTSNTSYYSRHQQSTSDYTQYLREVYLANPYAALPGDAGPSPFGDAQKNYYQEFRLSSSDDAARLTWNSGLFYSHQNENIAQTISDRTIDAETGGGACALIACPNGLILNAPFSRFIDKQVALFGEANFKITPTLKLTAGLRLARVSYDTLFVASGAFAGPVQQVFTGSASEKPVTPKVVLSYQPDPDELFYLSAGKGYRVGGVNGPLAYACAGNLQSIGSNEPPTYSSDSLWSYEIGTKNTLFERRLQINASLFWIDWKNIQQNVFLPGCGNQFVANLGQVTSRGGEVEAQFRPIRPLLLELSVAYTDAKFTKNSCAGSLVVDGTACSGPAGSSPPIVSQGDRLVGAPWTLLGSAEYSFPEIAARSPYFRIDYQFTTAQTALLPTQDAHNALNDTTIPGLPVTKNLSLRGGLRWDGFDVSLFVQNATDSHPVLYESRDIAAPFDTLYQGHTWRPRTIGLSATYRY